MTRIIVLTTVALAFVISSMAMPHDEGDTGAGHVVYKVNKGR